MANSRWKEIVASLRSDIESGKCPPGTRLPTETELAEQWKVSRMTVHRAMQEAQRQGLVVRKPRAGTTVAEPRRPPALRIALLSLMSGGNLEGSYLEGITHVLPEDSHLLTYHAFQDSEREARQLKRLHDIDGAIIFPTCAPENTTALQSVVDSGLPCVFIDRIPQGLNGVCVATDNYGVSREGMELLRQRGHRRIAHFTENTLAMSSMRERLEAYRDVMAQAGVKDVSPWLRLFPRPGMGVEWDFLRQSVEDALSAMLHQPEAPTAVFCLHDGYTSAVLDACAHLGLNVPGDLEILTFSDFLPMTREIALRLNRIVQRKVQAGETAAARLLALMRGETGEPGIERVPADLYPSVLEAERMDAAANGRGHEPAPVPEPALL